MPNIFDFLRANEVVAYANAMLQTQPTYVTSYLFPNVKQNKLKISEIQGVSGLPQLLTPSTLDAEPTLRGRKIGEAVDRELIFFREGMRLGEQERRDLQLIQASGNQTLVDSQIGTIMQDRLTLINGARARAEKLRIDVLTKGKIELKENGVVMTYDYGQTNFSNAKVDWSDPINSKPLTDIQDVQAKAKGVKITNIIMNQKTFNDMKQSEEVKKSVPAIMAAGGTITPIITDATVKQAFTTLYNINIVVDEDTYEDKEGNAIPFFPDDVVVLVPSGELGKTVFAPTPEEFDFMLNRELTNPNMELALIDNSIAVVSQYNKTIPIQILTTVSELLIPAFTRRKQVFVLNTKTAPGI